MRNKYHPLVKELFLNNLLSYNQLKKIPKTTKHNWRKSKSINYGSELISQNAINSFLAENRADHYKLKRQLLLILNSINQMLEISETKKKYVTENSKVIIESILVLKDKTTLKIDRICKLYGVTKNWYYKELQKLKCKNSLLKLCYRQFPNQLTSNEVSKIQQIISMPINEIDNLTTIYYRALWKKEICCSKSTFYKYAKLLGYKKRIYIKNNTTKSLKATRVFEWLHVDITNVKTEENGIQKVAFVKDNYSKSILHYKTTRKKAGSKFIKVLFKETFKKHNLYSKKMPINILSDGGSENKGEFLDWVFNFNAPPIINKVTAYSNGFNYSNNMPERLHSTLKTEYMKKKISKDITAHKKDLKEFVDYYNNNRYPTSLFGFTPNQVLNGSIPDRHFFKAQIQLGKKARIIENQTFNKCFFNK